MSRFISLLLSFCFSLNVFASSGATQELGRILDDYHYALTVDWDQKDQSFYEVKTKEFFSGLEKLIKEENLTDDQMINLLKSKIKDQSVVDSLVTYFNSTKDLMSLEHLMEVIKNSKDKIYSQGASWNGEIILYSSIILVFAAVIGYSLWFDANHDCVKYDSTYTCNSYNNCYWGSSDVYYGGYYCYGTVGIQTFCGTAEYCTEYVKTK